jgi:putative nucleotidyltransferase with HDIG domain
MADVDRYDDLVRRFAAAARSATLYTPDHPLIRRGIDSLAALSQNTLSRVDPVVIGFVGDDVVVNGQRLLKSAAALIGFARDLRDREIEKITIARGVTRDKIIDSLAKMVSQDRTSLMALTALKRYDNYTFTHMVNVSVLAMAQARSLNLEGPLLREFGFAALMHDIGKVHTPLEVLNKPDKLTKDEFELMKQHVVDGAHILRRTPEMPALAPVVAFEHHLRQDLSGYPENIGHRQLNLCTQIVSIADVYDALRSNRIYRQGLPSDRIKSILTQKDSPAFNTKLLRRFINLMGLFPVGTLVRLNTEEVAVVTHEHPTDPFRPQVKVLLDKLGQELEEKPLLNTWEPDGRGDFKWAVVEAVDPDTVTIDPLAHL